MGIEPGYLNLAERVGLEFDRRPALAITAWQLSDWFDLEDNVSERVLGALSACRWIERGEDGRYRRLIEH